MAVVTVKGTEYHIDEKLFKNWNKIKDGRLKKKDEDRVFIVDGREGTGKSVFAIQQAAYVDESILDDMSRITFTAEQTLNAIRNTRSTLEHTKAIIFDEAFKGLASRSAVSKINKTVIQALMEMRQNNLLLFIVLPSFYMLDLYPAVSRSNALIHISKDKEGQKRSFRVFNYAKKARLYDLGLKKGWNYKVYTNFKGRFSGKFPGGDEYYQKYLKAKQDALITTTNTSEIVNPDAGINKFELKARDELPLIYVSIQKRMGWSDKEAEEEFKKMGIPKVASQMSVYRGKVAKLIAN